MKVYRSQNEHTNPLDGHVARARFTVMNAHTEQQRIDAINAGHVIGYLDCKIELVDGYYRVYKSNRLRYVGDTSRACLDWARAHF